MRYDRKKYKKAFILSFLIKQKVHENTYIPLFCLNHYTPTC